MHPIALAFLMSLSSPAALTQPGDAPPTHPHPADARAEAADKAAAFLLSRQDPATGGWGVSPGRPVFPAITALALQGLLDRPGASLNDPAIARAVTFLLSHQQENGGIYDRILPTYNTAIALTALAKVPNPDARITAAVAKAQAYLKTLQFGEGAVAYESGETARVVGRDDPFYGAWGYGNHGRPDLSNSSFAIEALHASGLPENDAAFQRALVFLRRCQMLDLPSGDANDMPYAKGSTQGGFVYATSENKDRVGSGQSFAGEIAESLSGPPGASVTFSLKPGADGAPMTLSRDECTALLEKQKQVLASGGSRQDFIVLLGPGMSGGKSAAFEVRTATPDPIAASEFVLAAFRDSVDPGSLVATPVAHWQGESRLRAYGSMSYSGFKSYLYAGLTANDPRVKAAQGWIARNYTLEENPGVGSDGLYYYFLVFARALSASGLDSVPSPDGGAPRDWRADLVARLTGLQQPDGSFRPVDDRWMENDPVLITAYSLIALQEARR
ncbi:MAG: hypothetical protein DYG92_04595 [Leptolyngbya sp. PLA1]|nr:hypothetical protein [Leptolyngbya sp. PLA1]